MSLIRVINSSMTLCNKSRNFVQLQIRFRPWYRGQKMTIAQIPLWNWTELLPLWRRSTICCHFAIDPIANSPLLTSVVIFNLSLIFPTFNFFVCRTSERRKKKTYITYTSRTSKYFFARRMTFVRVYARFYGTIAHSDLRVVKI